MDDFGIPNEFKLPAGQDLVQLAGGDISPFQCEPPGPIGEGYMFGCEPIDLIMGPAGSAKTVCSIFRMFTVSMRFPVCADGVIRVRGCIMRDNYRTLYRTTLESLLRFLPKDFPGVLYEGGQDRPLKITARFRTPRGQMIQMVIDGFGVGQSKIQELLRGYEPSWGWMNECDLLHEDVPSFLFGRVAQNRYPPRSTLADPSAVMPKTVWGDFNPPLISHPLHQQCVEKGRWNLRRQPSGLSELAENRKHVPRETYEAMARDMKPDDVRRFVHGEWGLVGDGALVYPEYDFNIHCAKEPLKPLDMPLLIGADAGGSPALIIGQYTPRGHMRWLDELTTDPGTGVGRFAEMLIDLLQSKYRNLPIRAGWGDPSAFYGADRVAGELSFMEILGKAINLNIMPTATNDPVARQESVSWFLRRGRDTDGVPFFQHSPTMKSVQAGFQGGFMVTLNPHDTSQRIRFLKNKYSHPHEGGQYLCYGVRGHAGMINDAARAGRPGDNVVPFGSIRINSDFNP